jgi:dTDP-4-dehydrorhamnose 3,5-epimerase
MIFTPLPLAGAFRIDLDRREDARGFFARLFCAEEFADHGLTTTWLQCNTSFSQAEGTLRGLHFQRPPMSEAKMVRCLKGAIFDVIVDLRPGSPSFGQWTALELTAENRSMAYVPEGFAHGFQVLEKESELLYLHSEQYSPQQEDGLSPLDPRLSIPWPLPIAEMSDRDRGFPILTDKYKGVSL